MPIKPRPKRANGMIRAPLRFPAMSSENFGDPRPADSILAQDGNVRCEPAQMIAQAALASGIPERFAHALFKEGSVHKNPSVHFNAYYVDIDSLDWQMSSFMKSVRL